MKNYPPREIYVCDSGRNHQCLVCFLNSDQLSPCDIYDCDRGLHVAQLTRDLLALAKFLVSYIYGDVDSGGSGVFILGGHWDGDTFIWGGTQLLLSC